MNLFRKQTGLKRYFVNGKVRSIPIWDLKKTWMNLCELGDRQNNRNRPDRNAGAGCSGIGSH